MLFRASPLVIVNVHAFLYKKAVWKRIRPAYAIAWHSASEFGLKNFSDSTSVNRKNSLITQDALSLDAVLK
jgi:hypothetical protein